MATRSESGAGITCEQRKSGFGRGVKNAGTLDFSPAGVGQSCPQQYPPLAGNGAPATSTDILGQPMNIGQVAALLGCSVWTVRQRYLPYGLPHLRTGSMGKLVFYRNQIVRWILEKQRQKGGEIR
jgi:hypothetical protein